jgi:hypothetical protein
MKKRQSRPGKSASGVPPTFICQVGPPDYHLRKKQHERRTDALAELRAKRTKLKQAGRLDLARKYLRAPVQLNYLTKVLWLKKTPGGPPLFQPDTRIVFSPGYNFPKRFDLERAEGEPPVLHAADFHIEVALPMYRIVLAKFILGQRTAKKSGKTAVREWAIKCAGLWPLEEWACIFPDAALAGDIEFIKKVIAAHEAEPNPFSILNDRETILAATWSSSVLLSTSGDMVPPTKYFSDSAARELVRWSFADGEGWSLGAYQQLKKRLGLHKEKPTFVTWATYRREGNTHRLSCVTCNR